MRKYLHPNCRSSGTTLIVPAQMILDFAGHILLMCWYAASGVAPGFAYSLIYILRDGNMGQLND